MLDLINSEMGPGNLGQSAFVFDEAADLRNSPPDDLAGAATIRFAIAEKIIQLVHYGIQGRRPLRGRSCEVVLGSICRGSAVYDNQTSLSVVWVVARGVFDVYGVPPAAVITRRGASILAMFKRAGDMCPGFNKDMVSSYIRSP